MTTTAKVSTAPAVKAYLLTQTKATLTAAANERLLVVYNEPGTDLPGDIVSIGSVLNRVTEPSAYVGGGGQHWLTERYTVEVVVDVFRGGDRSQVAEERAWYLAGLVEQIVRTDPSLGGLVLEARPGAAESEGSWDEGHRGHRVRLTLAVDVYTEL